MASARSPARPSTPTTCSSPACCTPRCSARPTPTRASSRSTRKRASIPALRQSSPSRTCRSTRRTPPTGAASSSPKKKCSSTASRSRPFSPSDPHVAEEALALIQVDYEALPPVVDPIAAMEEGSPLVRSPLSDVDRSEERGHVTADVEQKEAEGKPTNIASQMNFKRGDIEAGFAEADVVVEHTWRSADRPPELHRAALDHRRLRRLGRTFGLDQLAGALLHPRRAVADARHAGEQDPRDRHRSRRRLRREDLPPGADGRRAGDGRPPAREVHHEPQRRHARGHARPAGRHRPEDRDDEGRHAYRTPVPCHLRLRRFPRRADAPRLPPRRRLLQVREPRHPGLRGAHEQGQRRRPARPRRAQRDLRHRGPHGHHGPRARPRPHRGPPQERRRRGRPAPQRPAVPAHRPQGVPRRHRRERSLETPRRGGFRTRPRRARRTARSAASASPSAAGSAASSPPAPSSA